MKMSRRQENPSFKAKKSREYRKKLREQRRFEAPLRQFVEIKYKEIYQEYVVLYKQMDAENPNKIDLRKTEIFRQWKKLNEQSNIDILTLAIKETIEAEHEQTEDSEADSEHEQTEDSEADSEHEQTEDNGADSEHEQTEDNGADSEHEQTEDSGEANNNLDIENPMWGVDEGLLAAQQVDQLVNQMIIDDELRAMLEPEPEDDEGIELNAYDELEMDIEPFDYRLEVELADW